MINQNVKEYCKKLEKLGISYQLVEHPELKTAEEVLSHCKLNFDDGVSTLIMRADDRFVALMRRDDCKLDFNKVKKVLNISKLRMATEREFEETTGLEIGKARPVNIGLETLIDEKILEKDFVQAGSGSFTCSIRYRTIDLRKIPNSRVVDIIENKVKSMTKKHRVFSGLRPTGGLHIGNYLGMTKGAIELQNRADFDCIYSVVDLHGITTPYSQKTYQKQIKDLVLDLLGAGLDPKKCHLMVQSQVPEHTELAYLLGTIFPVSRLEDLPTYKDKKAENPDYINMGLLYYPVLMAADILIYKADTVPVGKDQVPHIEITREFARKFNQMFGRVLPEPQAHLMPGAYVPSLKGEGKMSKSVEGSYILLTDDLKTIQKRLAGAPTDSGRGIELPKEGGVANLLELVRLFEGDEVFEGYGKQYLNEGIRYDRLKDNLAVAIYKELQPIQEKRRYYEENYSLVEDILEEGRDYCSKMAKETLQEVKEKMGLITD